MPDHACDRGAVRLDLGASRSQAYQPDPDAGGPLGRGSDRTQNIHFGVVRLDCLGDQVADH